MKQLLRLDFILLVGGISLVFNGFGNFLFKQYPVGYLLYMLAGGGIFILLALYLNKKHKG